MYTCQSIISLLGNILFQWLTQIDIPNREEKQMEKAHSSDKCPFTHLQTRT